jgi:phosphonate transport system substrate-binding protein
MSLSKALLLSVLVLLAPALQAAGKVHSFAVVPQQAAAELAETWSPVLAWLSARSGVELRFVTAPDIPAFERRLARGEYDFAYMNPYHYTVFHKRPGYAALAREKERRIKGILVVRKDSPIKDIHELDGAELVFPAPAAFAASILPRAALGKEGVVFKTRFVSSHDSVYLNVARGLYPAGGGIERTFGLLDPAERDQLRVLWTTPAYTPHAIASHPRLAPAATAKVQAAMVAMAADPVGQKLLQLIGFKGLEAARDADWDDIRHLRIAELEVR